MNGITQMASKYPVAFGHHRPVISTKPLPLPHPRPRRRPPIPTVSDAEVQQVQRMARQMKRLVKAIRSFREDLETITAIRCTTTGLEKINE